MLDYSNHLPTEELQAIDAAHHMHPFTDANALQKKGVRIIKSASGVFLKDTEGEEMLDAMAGLWCVNIGYGRAELADAAARQMRELPYYNTFFQSTHIPAITLASRIAELAPGDLNHVFFASGGSDANDTNIRLARHYWAAQDKPGKQIIVSRHNAYHGSSMGSASLGGMKPMHKQGGLPIADIVHIGQPDWWSEGEDTAVEDFGRQRASELQTAIEQHGEDRIAAFIAEPIQGAGGVIIPPESYWPEIRKICDAHEILLIADEVICGFGRTGNWFGSQTVAIQPDIMTIAKGLSSGYIPIGGSIVSDKVAAVVAAGGEFNHGYTYSGHPVSAAVALENLRIIDEEKLVEKVRNETGPYLMQKWAAFENHPLIGEARVCGMMGSMVLTPDKNRRAKFPGEAGKVGAICRDHCYSNNLIMRAVGDRMIISPPLIISEAEIDLLVERAGRALDATYQQLKIEGML